MLALMLCASALASVVTAACFILYLGGGTPLFNDIRTYIALRKTINQEYIGEVDDAAVSQAALSAAVEALGDRWSFYLTPEQLEAYLDASSNQYAGFGVLVAKDEATGGLAILAVYPGSGAEEAGLLAGEVILAADGEDITALSFEEAADKLTRQEGESARLLILGTDGTEREVTVKASLVVVSPVRHALLDGNVGYVAIDNFEAHAAERFIAAVEELMEQGAGMFVFDVRDNRGGRVKELVDILDYLLPEGEIFVSVSADGKEKVLTSDEKHLDVPAVVLVNARSYSAAEYFAAVLQEYKYAAVVGTRTTGKNRSQNTFLLPDGGGLHISTGEYLTPGRVSLTETGGLTPDVYVALSEEKEAALEKGALSREEDDQLLAALRLLMENS